LIAFLNDITFNKPAKASYGCNSFDAKDAKTLALKQRTNRDQTGGHDTVRLTATDMGGLLRIQLKYAVNMQKG